MSPFASERAEPRSSAALPWAWGCVLLAAAYFAAGKLALLLAIPPGYATAVWPAAGIALVGLLLGGPRLWPGIWLGSALTNIDASLDPDRALPSLAVAGAIGLGASVQALVGAALVRRFVGFPTALTAEREVLRFLALGGPVACLVSASCGVATLTFSGLNPSDAATFSWFTWWVGDTIGVLITAPLLLMWLSEPAEVWRPRRLSVGVPLLVTFAVTVGVFVFASRWEWDRGRGEFERQAEVLSRRVEENVSSYIQVLRSVAGLYAGSEIVERDEFHTFVQSLIVYHPGIQAVSWNPRVTDAGREAFEQAVRLEGFSDFRIAEQDDGGELVAAASRADYYPVTYIEPYEGNESALGFDTASETERRAVQREALEAGDFRVTSRLRLVQEGGEAAGVLVYVPVFPDRAPHGTIEQRRLNHEGFVAGVFRIDDVMATAVSGADLEGIDLRLVDAAAEADRALLWGEPPRVDAGNDGYTYQHAMNLTGLRWTIHAVRDGRYLVAHRSLTAWMALLGGLLLDSLLGCFLLMLTGRAARIEALVSERTTQLSHAAAAAEQELRERVEAEQALRTSESQFRSVTESANDAIVVMDAEGLILRWNAAAQRNFGFEEHEAIGRSAALLVPERYRESYRQELARLKSGDEPTLVGRLIEIEGLRKDGTEFPVEISWSSWWTEEGRFHSAVLRDVTDRHRTALELQQALEEAESASQAKGDFLANMSHEIRTPMNAVIAMARLLKDTPLDERQYDFVETIRTSGDYLLDIINDILDFSKVDAGHLELETSCFDVRRCIEEAIELIAPEASRKGLRVRELVAEDVPDSIWTDAGRLRQVLVNLLSNAVKFTEQGQVEVEVEARDVARDGGHSGRRSIELHFRVWDTGIGIPEDRIGQLFEAFTQVDSSVTRRFGGTGLGLAISKRLCELLGGRLWAESELGRGSTFHFTIAAETHAGDSVRESRTPTPAAHPSGSDSEAPLPALRVLIAEDSGVNQKVARLMLERLGLHDVDAVANGVEALQALERQRYDLVLMDVQMPEMDGLAATRAICARWGAGERPLIVATTAHALVGDRDRCFEAGMDGYVSKPIQIAALSAELRRVLGRSS